MKFIYMLFLSIVLLFFVCVVHAQHGELVSMDFNNVDLMTIIKFMSELTGKNFIVDSEVKGNATIISPTKIPVDEAYKVLESILIVNGYTTVPSDNVIKVIPLAEAKKLDIETQVGKEIVGKGLKDRMITQIVPLEYADVNKLTSILTPYVSSEGYIASYPPTNTLIITDASSNLDRLLEITKSLDQKLIPQPENVHVYYVQNTDAEKISKILNKVYIKKKQDKEELSEPPTIVADDSTNSLIVLSSPQEYAFLEKLIAKLDKRKPQVLVEAIIAEVTLQKTLELGLELVAAGGIVYGSSRGFAGAESKGMVENILTGGNLPGTTAGVVEGTTTRANVTMPNLGLLVTASRDTDDINILSAPQVLATDNEEAQILVGKNLAFIKNTQVTAEGGTVRTFEYKDVGLLLKIVPHITEDDYVRLEITQQVEDVIGQSFEGAIETSKREAKTNIMVKDKSTVVIGGLLIDRDTESVQKVPVLGDVPIVGLLFRRTQTESEKMNLFLFITPHIVRSEGDLEKISTERRKLVGQ